MFYSSCCVSCGSKAVVTLIHRRRNDGFIVDYVLNGQAIDAALVFCKKCKLLFTSPRFDEREAQRLYANYRGERYNAARIAVEPSYETVARFMYERHSSEAAFRRKLVYEIITKSVNTSSFRSVCDYGGEDGLFIPDFNEGTEKYVVEQSDVVTIDGVKRIPSLDEKAPYDLILCMHVLEHISADLSAAVSSLGAALGANGVLYIEVPYDGIPLFIKRNPWDLAEHINFFTKTSLLNLLSACDLDCVRMFDHRYEMSWTTANVISAVCIKAKSRNSNTSPEWQFYAELIAFCLRVAARKAKNKFSPVQGQTIY